SSSPMRYTWTGHGRRKTVLATSTNGRTTAATRFCTVPRKGAISTPSSYHDSHRRRTSYLSPCLVLISMAGHGTGGAYLPVQVVHRPAAARHPAYRPARRRLSDHRSAARNREETTRERRTRGSPHAARGGAQRADTDRAQATVDPDHRQDG